MSVYETFDGQKQFACRVIADHARATAFAIADGILPGNEGRNYVLRKIMRRAIYHGRETLGFKDLFFHQICGKVVEEMGAAYPELVAQRDSIITVVRREEEQFVKTLEDGLKRFEEDFGLLSLDPVLDLIWQKYSDPNAAHEELDKGIKQVKENFNRKFGETDFYMSLARITLENKIPPYLVQNAAETHPDRLPDLDGTFHRDEFASSLAIFLGKASLDDKGRMELLEELNHSFDENKKFPSFKELAKLYDTFGMPRDLIRVALEKQDISLDEDSFNKFFDAALIELQKQGNIGKTHRNEKINPIYGKTSETIGASAFHGYERTDFAEARVTALIQNDQRVEEIVAEDEGLIVLSETPFYAESGGQVGDTGVLYNADFHATVLDTYAPIAGLILHKAKIEKGTVKIGDVITAQVDVNKRDATRRNHTATHLLHAALREVLGTHVKQAGSVVAPQFLRFDFSHYQPLAPEEIREIEDLVNREILRNDPVNTNLMPVEEAMRSGAMALFGEKYGSDVRVLSIGEGKFSKELCGGTHVRATGDIGSFKILSDEAVASGVRRIRAITGLDAFARFREDENLLEKSLGALRTQRDNLPNAIERLQEELKRTRREVEDLKMKIATGAIGTGAANGSEPREVNGIKVIAQTVEGLDKGGMRHLSDTLLAKLKSGVVVLGRAEDDKVSFIVRVSDDLTGKIKAGNIVKELAPIVGGRGGGKPDMAEGGGNDASKLDAALQTSYKVVEQMLG